MNEVEAYLAPLPAADRTALEHLRQLVRVTVPEAVELMSYGLPAYKYKNKPLVYFGAFKDHLSLFPTSEPTNIFKDRLSGFKVSKGTIQFTAEQPLPDDLVIDILQHRVASIDN